MIDVLILKKGKSGFEFSKLSRKNCEENLVADKFKSLSSLSIV